MPYVDGYVIAVPRKNKSEYIRLAEESAVVFKDHGALSVVENWADDVPTGELTSLPKAVKCEDGEDVVFSWITWGQMSLWRFRSKIEEDAPLLLDM